MEYKKDLYSKYLNKPELVKIEMPGVYRLWEHHIKYSVIKDTVNAFNNFLFDFLFNEKEEVVD
jgi:hypothetical protein